MRQSIAAALCVLLLAGCGHKTEQASNTSNISENTPVPNGRSAKEPLGGIGSIESKVTAALANADAQKSLNAFNHLNRSGALERARSLDKVSIGQGALHGMLLAVKDNIHVAGMPNTAGTPALRRFVPKADNPVVQRLKDAGAIVLGKANMHELAFGITSDNAAFGPVRNPLDPSKFAGGSSGGTAAAIAAGLADAGLGTDTGGSTRIPAALTGVAGFRPTSGRYPGGAVTPVSQTRDTVGPLARNVRDLIRLDSAITGDIADIDAVDLSSIRLGLDREYYFSNLDPDTERSMKQSLDLLQQAGVTIVPAKVPQLSKLLAKSGFPIVFYEVVRELPEYLAHYETAVSFEQLQAQLASADVQAAFAGATGADTAITTQVYQQALAAKAEISTTFETYFAQHKLDAMVFPTTKLPARNIEGSLSTVELNGQQVPTFPSYIHNTDPASLAGIPAVTLPAGLTPAGLPIGVELDGPAGSDQRLLAIALAVEEILNNMTASND